MRPEDGLARFGYWPRATSNGGGATELERTQEWVILVHEPGGLVERSFSRTILLKGSSLGGIDLPWSARESPSAEPTAAGSCAAAIPLWRFVTLSESLGWLRPFSGFDYTAGECDDHFATVTGWAPGDSAVSFADRLRFDASTGLFIDVHLWG